MQNKKLGVMLIIASLAVGGIIFSLISSLNSASAKLGCTPTQQCVPVESRLYLSYVGVGILSAILSLGLYILLFSKSEEAILQRLEEEKNKKIEEDKFGIALSVLDDYEKNVLTAIKEQPGITQSTLKFRANISKAKLSQILRDFEQRRLIAREKKNKTYSVFLTKPF